MWFNNLLLKIETGQELTKSQEKRLAKHLMLAPSVMRIFVYVVFSLSALLFLYVGFIGGYSIITLEISLIIAVLLILLIVLFLTVPKHFRIKRYLQTVNKFYETKFFEYDNLDLYYIDQHISPYVKPLTTKKIYLLTDGYHFLFVSDPFKNTTYKMPKRFSYFKDRSYLRVINSKVGDYSQIMVRLEDIEHFYISSLNFPEEKELKKNKNYSAIKYFFNQTPNYVENCIVVLKLKSGVILRLSHETYPIFKNLIQHKEKTYEF